MNGQDGKVPEFAAFSSIPRLFRDCIVTEKLDGTNAQVFIGDDGTILAGSRSRWITPGADNFGFASWVAAHVDELRSLGPGFHYGEWWGAGIQRRYGLTEKRFSLFNVGRWGEGGKDADKKPACCHVVPVLYRGPFDTVSILGLSDLLKANGSYAAPGFMDPEGIVVWHEKAQALFKYTLGGDGHKGARP
jgi:hypothetical protein